LTAGKLAWSAVDRFGIELCTAVNQITGLGYVLHDRLKPNYGGGRDGIIVMRINDIKKRFRNGWEIVIYFFVNTAADKGKGFDQPFGMGIGRLVVFEQQASGNLGVFLCKLRPHLPDIAQLLFVVVQQCVIHIISSKFAQPVNR